MGASKYSAQAIRAGFMAGTVSKEENDLNITIQAEHEGDKGAGEEAGVPAEVPAVAEEPVMTEEAPAAEEVPAVGGEEPAVDPATDEPAVVETPEDTSGTPEAAELDVQDAGEGVEETEEQIENINDAAEGLEGLVLTIAQISVEGIEVTPLAAQLLRDQYQFAVRKFPKLAASEVVASCEAWAADSEQAGTVSLEKAMDTLKNAYRAGMEMLKTLWEKFKALLGSVLSAASVMRKKAEQIRDSKPGKQPEKVNVPALLGSGLSSANIKKLTAVIKALTVSNMNVVNEAVNKGSNIEAAFKTVNADTIKTAGLGSALLGGFKITASESGVLSAQAVEGNNASRAPFSAGDIKSMAADVVELAKAIEDYKRSEPVRKKLNEFIIAELNKATSGGEDQSKYAKWQNTRKAAGLWAKQSNAEQTIIRRAIAAGNAINNVLSASLGAAAPEKNELVVAK